MSSRVPLIAGIAALSFFAGITGIHLAYTLTYILLSLIILAFLWTRAIARRISVDRTSPEGTFSVGEAFSERFTVHNRSLMWVPYCEIHDRSDLPGYAAGRACDACSRPRLPRGDAPSATSECSRVRWTMRTQYSFSEW